jgi:circadian clock protein KaiB
MTPPPPPLSDAAGAGRHKIEVLDLAENAELAAPDQIIALPTLLSSLPPPLKRMIGTLADPEKFLIGLDYNRLAS